MKRNIGRGGQPPLPKAIRLLSWNCQELGNHWTGQNFSKIVKE